MSRDGPDTAASSSSTPSPEPRPALTYARSSDPLMALPPPSDLHSNVSPLRRIFHVAHYPLPLRRALTCGCIALNTLTANGVYAWPQYGPVVLRRAGLSPAQGQVVVTMGICGTYLMAAPLGSLCDRRGPRFASFLSAGLAAAGYGIFALVLTRLDGDPSTTFAGLPPHLALGACYFLVGMAAVGSYFAALTTASLSFPRTPTLALSLPLAAIGMSSLFLSSLARLPVFAVRETHARRSEVDPVRYLVFLAAFVAGVNMLSSVFMRILPSPPLVPPSSPSPPGTPARSPSLATYPDSPSHLLNPDERTPLLIGGPEAAYAAAREEAEAAKDGHVGDEGGHVHWDVRRLVRNPGFWCFGALIALAVGPPEMILSSIGSILTSLLPPDASILRLVASAPDASALRSRHILILSLSSTLARLATGALADYLAPLVPRPSTSPHASVRRSTLAAGCVAVLLGVFVWGAVGLCSEASLWVISAGTGAMYGAVFTLLPAITSKHYGPAHFGLAWGMLSYFSALGSVVFSYVFALFFSLSADRQRQSADGPAAMCYGAECFRGTFIVSAAAAGLAFMGLLVLGRRWRL